MWKKCTQGRDFSEFPSSKSPKHTGHLIVHQKLWQRKEKEEEKRKRREEKERGILRLLARER